MRYLSVISLVLMGILSIQAQVNITSNDMPSAGEFFPYTFATDPNVTDHALTGQDYTWDYSDLEANVNDVDTFLSVGETPVLFQFFFNNPILYPDHYADHAKDEIDINLGIVNITDSYSYFKNDSEGYRNVGFGANVNGIPSSVRNIPVDWLYQFPLQYGDAHTSSSASEIEIPGIGYYSRELEREVTVEGWGTLVLPDATYDVLKVKMVINSLDSIYLENLGQGTVIPNPEQTVYQFLTPGEIQPVLEISQQLGFGALIRHKYAEPSSLEESSEIDLKVFPNPAQQILYLRSSSGPIASYAVFDASGRLILRKEGFQRSEAELTVRNFAKGEYFVLLEVEGRSYYSSFFKN